MPPGERTRKLLERFEKGPNETSPSGLRHTDASNLIGKAPVPMSKIAHFEPQVGRRPIVPGRVHSSSLPAMDKENSSSPSTPGRPHSKSLPMEPEPELKAKEEVEAEVIQTIPGAFPEQREDFAAELQPRAPQPYSSYPTIIDRPFIAVERRGMPEEDLTDQAQEIAILQARLRETSMRYNEAMLDAQRTKEELEKEHAALDQERKVKDLFKQRLKEEHGSLEAERKAKEDLAKQLELEHQQLEAQKKAQDELEEQICKGDDELKAERQAKHELAEELLKEHTVLEAERRAKEEVQQELFLSMAKESELHVERKELMLGEKGEDMWQEMEGSVWDETQAIYRTMQSDWDAVRGTVTMIVGELKVVGPYSLLPGLK